MNKELFFARETEEVILPSKREGDAGYDIYAFFEEESIVIKPHETKLIPTGLYSALSNDYYIQLVERGSTGSKGIAQRCGVIDASFRGEWFVPITNTTNKSLVITKEVNSTQVLEDVILYPYSKAIAQAVVLPVPKMEIVELSKEELQLIESERGVGALGSSNK